MITQKLNLNLIPGRVPPRVKFNRFDHDKKAIELTIYNGSALFNLSGISSILVQGTKPDKKGFQYPVPAANYSGSVVSIDLTEQMTAVDGDVVTELSIYDSSGNRVGTGNFIIDVEPAALDDNTKISETQLPLIEEALKNAEKIYEKAGEAEEFAKRAKESADTAISASETATGKAVEASQFADTAAEKATAANVSAEKAASSEENAKGSEDSAKRYADSAKTSESNVESLESSAKTSAEAAEQSAQDAQASEGQTRDYKEQAENYAKSALDAIEQVNKKLTNVEFDVNDDGELVYNDTSPYAFTVDGDGYLNWEVA